MVEKPTDERGATMNPVLSICEGYQLDMASYTRTGLRVGIWASSGRGKSFGVGVFCEELLAAGIPVIAIDPEGELHTLREQFRVLVLGGEQGDLPLPSGPAGIRFALDRALDGGVGLVVDLSEKPSNRSQQEAARPWFETLWTLISEQRRPAALVVEEVHIFAPQSGSAITADIMQRFAKQGRKRGAILVAASQRTQAVSKEFMSQLNFSCIGGFETERDYEAVKAVVDGHSFDEFRALETGRFYLSSPGTFDRWRPRRTSHGGDSPTWDPAEANRSTARDSALDELVEQLRSAFAEDEPVEQESVATTVDRARIRVLEQELSAGQKQLAEAKRELSNALDETNRLRIALLVAGSIKVMITQEIIARTPALAVPAAAVALAGGTVQQEAAVAAPPSPSAPQVEVRAVAKPAPPVSLVQDVKLTPAAILAIDDIKSMVRRARERARRRSPQAGEWCQAIVKSLVGGAAINPVEMAGRYGYHGKVTFNRIEAMLDALVAVGFATYKSGQYYLNEPYIRQLILKA
ncbi:MAG: hypothetical protein JWN15_2339 [Firmicutes bacterium]|nr:hypothetical protein [Bacillota bacterium]